MLHIISRKSGTKTYSKVTGDILELAQVSRRTHEPIKPAGGKNPAHIDVPEKKISRMQRSK